MSDYRDAVRAYRAQGLSEYAAERAAAMDALDWRPPRREYLWMSPRDPAYPFDDDDETTNQPTGDNRL